MTTLIDNIITILKADFSISIDDALRNAGFLFEKARGTGTGMTPLEQRNQFAWTPEVIAATWSPHDVGRLRDAITVFLRRRPPPSHMVSALWALSKLADTTTKSVLVETLHSTLNKDPDALFQAMIALANIGEDVFNDQRSMSGRVVEVNRTLARAYLQRQGRLP